jgi:hypothetical protein
MPLPPSTRAAAAAAATLAALALAGCSGARDTGEGRQIQSAIKAFALADGPDACRMFSQRALVEIYGAGDYDRRVARRNCLARSKRFTGQAVEITFVKLTGDGTAHATARTLDRKRYYTVGLLKRHGRWLIDGINRLQSH